MVSSTLVTRSGSRICLLLVFFLSLFVFSGFTFFSGVRSFLSRKNQTRRLRCFGGGAPQTTTKKKTKKTKTARARGSSSIIAFSLALVPLATLFADRKNDERSLRACHYIRPRRSAARAVFRFVSRFDVVVVVARKFLNLS